MGRESLDGLDQLFVGASDRPNLGCRAVGVLDVDVLEAVDVDVLDVLVVQQRLQAACAEQPCLQSFHEILPRLPRERVTARLSQTGLVVADDPLDECLAVLDGIRAGERRQVRRSAARDVLLPKSAQFRLEALDQRVVEVGHRRPPTMDGFDAVRR